MRLELVVCPDCLAEVECWDGDVDTVLSVHVSQDCDGGES